MSFSIKKSDYIIGSYKIRHEGGEYIIFLKKFGEYFVINDTGKDIISFFSDRNICDSLEDFLKKEYGVLTPVQECEIIEYIKQLQELKLLEKR